jgi:hypothetical protein
MVWLLPCIGLYDCAYWYMKVSTLLGLVSEITPMLLPRHVFVNQLVSNWYSQLIEDLDFVKLSFSETLLA